MIVYLALFALCICILVSTGVLLVVGYRNSYATEQHVIAEEEAEVQQLVASLESQESQARAASATASATVPIQSLGGMSMPLTDAALRRETVRTALGTPVNIDAVYGTQLGQEYDYPQTGEQEPLFYAFSGGGADADADAVIQPPHWLATQQEEPSAICCQDADDPTYSIRTCKTCEQVSKEFKCENESNQLGCDSFPSTCRWDASVNVCKPTGVQAYSRVPCTLDIKSEYCGLHWGSSIESDMPEAKHCCEINAMNTPWLDCQECGKIRNTGCWLYGGKDECTSDHGQLGACEWNTSTNKCVAVDAPFAFPSTKCGKESVRYCSPTY